MYLTPSSRIALLMHEGTQSNMGKTGLSMLRYSEATIVAIIDYQSAGLSLSTLTGIQRDVPIVGSVDEALAYQPNVLAIGIAPSGGKLPDPWFQDLKQAVAAGLSLVNALHTPLAQHPDLASSLRPEQWIWDVRQEPLGLTVGTGKARQLPCKRILAVGTDMSVGKMSTILELNRACQAQGLNSKIIATGQTNLMLGDDGIPLDAVRVDYASGAVEMMIMRYGYDYDYLLIEGQGSLLNPASTATLPLLRGAQPTHLILCHRAGQTEIYNCPQVKIPPLPYVIELYEQVAGAGGAFLSSKVVGIALNTGHLSPLEAAAALEATEQETGLPCTDPIRCGAQKLLAAITT
jgi:uncharacterized NAD-dependent epimerase/dehydratase family protein